MWFVEGKGTAIRSRFNGRMSVVSAPVQRVSSGSDADCEEGKGSKSFGGRKVSGDSHEMGSRECFPSNSGMGERMLGCC